ncbi:MAG: hypothetical protein OEU92_08225, partial [Alphaproteobacteria bacterium]|nr:hypothetical protein [Alphaproteobacteria bacterium]
IDALSRIDHPATFDQEIHTPAPRFSILDAQSSRSKDDAASSTVMRSHRWYDHSGGTTTAMWPRYINAFGVNAPSQRCGRAT